MAALSTELLLDQIKDLNNSCRKLVVSACAFGLILTIVIYSAVTKHVMDAASASNYVRLQNALDRCLSATYDQSFNNRDYSSRALAAYIATIDILTMTTSTFPRELSNIGDLHASDEDKKLLLEAYSDLTKYKATIESVMTNSKGSAYESGRAFSQLSSKERQEIMDVLFFEDTLSFDRIRAARVVIGKYAPTVNNALRSAPHTSAALPRIAYWKELYSQGFSQYISQNQKSPFTTIVDRSKFLDAKTLAYVQRSCILGRTPDGRIVKPSTSSDFVINYDELSKATEASKLASNNLALDSVTIPIVGISVSIDGLVSVAPLALFAFVISLVIILSRYRILVKQVHRREPESDRLRILVSDFPLVTSPGPLATFGFGLMVAIAPIIAAISPLIISNNSSYLYQIGRPDPRGNDLYLILWLVTGILLLIVVIIKVLAQQVARDLVPRCMLRSCSSEKAGCEGCLTRSAESGSS